MSGQIVSSFHIPAKFIFPQVSILRVFCSFSEKNDIRKISLWSRGMYFWNCAENLDRISTIFFVSPQNLLQKVEFSQQPNESKIVPLETWSALLIISPRNFVRNRAFCWIFKCKYTQIELWPRKKFPQKLLWISF